MEAKNFIHGRYLGELILEEQSLDIKNFEDWTVGSNGKERTWRWKSTSSDGLVIRNSCKFVDLFWFIEISSEIMMGKCEVLMFPVKLIIVNYAICLLKVLNVLPWRLFRNLLLLKVYLGPSVVVLLEFKVFFADWYPDSFLWLYWYLGWTSWQLSWSPWSFNQSIRPDGVASLLLFWNLLYLFLLVQFWPRILIFMSMHFTLFHYALL